MLRSAVLVAALATPTGLGGWIVPWHYDAGMTSLREAGGAIGDVFLFAARLDDAGRPMLDERKGDWPQTVALVKKSGARVWLTVVNDRVAASGAATLKDADVVHAVLADPGRSREHRAAIVALARELSVDGVDIDYENLPAAEREAFTTFARDLATDLHAAGLAASITVQPKSRDSDAKGPGAMDWAALCRCVDRVQLMLYNEHNASTEPGPVAGVEFVSKVVDYGLKRCPASRLVPVLKVSGMDWGPDKATWLSFAEADSVIRSNQPRIRRTWKDGVPWFTYRGPEGKHVVYYEDAKSLAAKAKAVRARGIRAMVLWSLGSEDPETIPRLSSMAGQKR
jgi:spore germination protein YaaH